MELDKNRGLRNFVACADHYGLHRHGAGFPCFLDDFVEAVMGDDGQPVHRHKLILIALRNPRAIRQAQATAQGLLGQDVRSGEPKRDDGVKIGHVPALLELVDVDDHLGAAVPRQSHQALRRLLVFLAAQSRMHPPLKRNSKNKSRKINRLL
jgi:hypothetical protein